MRMWRGFWALGAILAMASPAGSVVIEATGSDVVEMEPVVVTATGTDVPLKDSTQSVTIITGKQVQERQAVRVEEMTATSYYFNLNEVKNIEAWLRAMGYAP